MLLCHLPDHVADRSGRGRHDHGVTPTRFADVEQTEVRGQPIRAEHAEMVAGVRCGRRRADIACAQHGVASPPGRSDHCVTDCDVWRRRLLDHANSGAGHDDA